jgi:hypothetical protein
LPGKRLVLHSFKRESCLNAVVYTPLLFHIPKDKEDKIYQFYI